MDIIPMNEIFVAAVSDLMNTQSHLQMKFKWLYTYESTQCACYLEVAVDYGEGVEVLKCGDDLDGVEVRRVDAEPAP